MRRLLAARAAPLVLLAAPAGYGKTTLLHEWAEEDGRPFAWVDLDGADSGPGRLLRTVVRAARDAAPFDIDHFAALEAPTPSRAAAAIPALGRALSDCEGGIVVVIDDAQTLHSRGSLDALANLIEHLDEDCQVVLAARAEPALPLGALRASRMLVELRASDLAMTQSEAAALVGAHGVELDPDVLELLVHRTEGWPAALYLATLAMDGEPQPSRTLEQFAGNDRYVADYLEDEVLGSLSEELVAFLAGTSVLERLSGPLCDHLLERSDSALLLKQLSRTNLMVLPLDRFDDEYRFHRLFAEALQGELRRHDPELESALHQRASEWYDEHGDADRAIEHAIAAGDAARAGELLWSHAASYAGYGHSAELAGWLARFGDEQLASTATLALTAAAGSLVNGDRNLVERWTAAALGALEDEPQARGSELEGEITILRASVSGEPLERVAETTAQACASAPDNSPWQALGRLLEGVARHLGGERERARRLLEDGARRGAAAAPHIQVLCLAQLGLLAIERRDWAAADSLASRARAQVERAGLGEYATSALVYAVAAHVEAQGGRVETAQADLRQACHLLARAELSPWYHAECQIALARAALRLSDVPQARALLAAAERQLESAPDARVPREWIAECQAQAEASSASAGGGWALTTAELRVLQFLPTHLSFPEMAERLYVSANTVKTHARSVYRKLEASSRGEAVVKARTAGLLDQASHAGVGTTGLAGLS
ncbi:MAG TPA: LuxR C-terminal-related transcriptional regulator [Thermoleophilaceae bacterium]